VADIEALRTLQTKTMTKRRMRMRRMRRAHLVSNNTDNDTLMGYLLPDLYGRCRLHRGRTHLWLLYRCHQRLGGK
jgi:hypothetical protein